MSEESLTWSDLSNQILQIQDEGEVADISSYTDNQSDSSSQSRQVENILREIELESIDSNILQQSDLTLPREHDCDQEQVTTMSKWLDNTTPLTSKRGKSEVLTLGISVAKEERKDTKRNDNSQDAGSSTQKNPLLIPPKQGEPTEKVVIGTKLYWCSKCGQWTNHKTDAHPTDNDANPQGNVADNDENHDEDIGDDSATSESGNFAKVTGFLSLPNATHF